MTAVQPVTSGTTPPGATDRQSARLALLAGLVTVVLWASAFVGIRDAGQALSPGPLALLRLVVACAVLGAFVAWRRDPLPPRRLLPGLVACGVLWLGVYNLALNAAEQRVDAGTAAMLVNLGPIFIAVLAGVVLREGFPRNLLIGAAIAFLGCVVIGLSLSAESTTLGVGALLCVVAAAAYASGVILQKPLLREISALQVTFLACAVGAVVCLPFVVQLADELPERTGRVGCVGDLPRRLPDRARIHHLGVCASAHICRSDGRADLPRAADRHPARLGIARRGAARSGHRRRGVVSRRSDLDPARLTCPP